MQATEVIFEVMRHRKTWPRAFYGPVRFTKALGVTRKTLSQLLNGHIGVSPIMAIRLALATDTTAESWLNMQTAYDLWQAKRKHKRLKVERLKVA